LIVVFVCGGTIIFFFLSPDGGGNSVHLQRKLETGFLVA